MPARADAGSMERSSRRPVGFVTILRYTAAISQRVRANARPAQLEEETVEPKIASRPAFTVAGLMHRGGANGGEIAALWRRFSARMGELQSVVEPEVAYGVMTNYDEATGEFDYVAASQVSEDAALPAGFVAVPVPAGEWAVFTTTMPDLAQTYPSIYDVWLPQSGYQRRPVPEFELYGPSFDPDDPACEFEIYIPIVKG